VPAYFWLDPLRGARTAFTLRAAVSVPIARDTPARLYSLQLDVAWVQWTDIDQQLSVRWWRWATLTGVLLSTSEEALAQEHQSATAAQQRVLVLEALLACSREHCGDIPQ
jgi:hypothetical protein